MKHLRWLVVAVMSAPAFISPAAQGASLRCNGDLVRTGDTMETVLAKCGEPASKQTSCIPVAEYTDAIGGGHDGTRPVEHYCVNVDRWVYNPGPGQFLTMLRFERGKLTTMTYGARVR